jgi:hypothetical protein
VVVEWLNVSSGSDAAPDWTYLSDEIVRRGHAWVGVSPSTSASRAARRSWCGRRAADRDQGRERYAALSHPGDAYCYSIYGVVARRSTRDRSRTWSSTYCSRSGSRSRRTRSHVRQRRAPQLPVFGGFLVHSRGGGAMPLGEPGRPWTRGSTGLGPGPIRDDLDVPVIMVQTETDLVGLLDYLPARQDDSELVRLWEVAGTAHADRFQIGEFEELLGCPRPVNRGQQAYVVRAALRRLDGWARGGDPAPAPSG